MTIMIAMNPWRALYILPKTELLFTLSRNLVSSQPSSYSFAFTLPSPS